MKEPSQHAPADRDSRRSVTRGSRLLANGIDSIRIGVEDFKAADPARARSSIRNLHAGLLLLRELANAVVTARKRGDAELVDALPVSSDVR